MEENESIIEVAEQQSSVKLAKNSKGYSWEIKVYDDDAISLKDRLKCNIKIVKGLIAAEESAGNTSGSSPEGEQGEGNTSPQAPDGPGDLVYGIRR